MVTNVADQAVILQTAHHPLAYLALVIFVLAYIFVVFEETLHLEKSKPMIMAAGIMWVLVAIVAKLTHTESTVHESLISNLEEYAQLFLFLLVAMTYINAMSDRNVFQVLKAWLVRRGWSYRTMFLATGIIAFFLSALLDNLTTSLVMGAVVTELGRDNKKFICLSCIGIVIAANAGGAFSPFGDITTLMVWQSGKADFFRFFELFIPSAINYLVPALIMYMFIPKGRPPAHQDEIHLKPFGKATCILFACSVALAVCFEQFLGLPPFMGMMTGVSLLLVMTYISQFMDPARQRNEVFNPYMHIANAEWDTLLFFFGVMFCVGALGHLGYLLLVSQTLYTGLGPTTANVIAGLLSSVVDNIPVTFAILTMDPAMSVNQWLLVALCAGVGGSLLSVGSAAGVALMGQSRGVYTFFSHLKWTWAILLGYALSIGAHLLINGL